MSSPSSKTQPSAQELKRYYSDYFPADLVWDFITKSFGHPSHNAMVGFTFEKKKKISATFGSSPRVQKAKEKNDEFHTRYIHAKNAEQLRHKLVVHLPTGVSIGGLYSVPGELMKAASDISAAPIAKILSLDFDFDEFERSCECNGKKMVCEKCWATCQELMELVKLSSTALVRCTPLLSFSKSKGFHVHYPSPRLSTMSQSDRRNFLSLMEGRVTKECVSGIFDKGVTLQMDHTIRLPLTIASSGNVVMPIEFDTLLEDARIHVKDVISGTRSNIPLPARWVSMSQKKFLFEKKEEKK